MTREKLRAIAYYVRNPPSRLLSRSKSPKFALCPGYQMFLKGKLDATQSGAMKESIIPQPPAKYGINLTRKVFDAKLNPPTKSPLTHRFPNRLRCSWTDSWIKSDKVSPVLALGKSWPKRIAKKVKLHRRVFLCSVAVRAIDDLRLLLVQLQFTISEALC
jgi:hypothetical protein